MADRDRADGSQASSPVGTLREQCSDALKAGFVTLRDLSGVLHQSEKDVAYQLDKLLNFPLRGGQAVSIDPAACLACGYLFDDRRRASKPSKCPKCRSTRIRPPRFGYEGQ